jgi:iron complex outermembrane receptor protein
MIFTYGFPIQLGAAENAEALESDVGLADLSLEELMDIEITSVSKKEERLFETAAAVTVLTNEDIRRSGATSIPEALRMVPGLQVAQINANAWAISSRGFNSEFANKLLVMIDGRSVYSPLFAGVFWDVQQVMLEDVDRIEVIKGPGGSLWGANAVNGIINIITKSAEETQGGLFSGGGGTELHGFGGLRYGGQLDDETYYRVYSRYFNIDDGVDASGNEGTDEWDMLQGGFRFDQTPSDQDQLTFQGDIYQGRADEKLINTPLTPPFISLSSETLELSGGNLLGRWSRQVDEDSDTTWQVYYDRAKRRHYSFHSHDVRDTVDIDFQHRLRLDDRQELVWGLGYRFTTNKSEIDSAFFGGLTPSRRDMHLYSGFLSHDIMLVEEKLKLTLGSKFEHNDFTGFEVQPGARLLWTPDEKQSIWTSVTRAVRTPSRIDHDMLLVAGVIPMPPGPPVQMLAIGDDGFDSETLTAYELGYRVQPKDNLAVDISTFYNDYDELQVFRLGSPAFNPVPVTHVDQPLIVRNGMEGKTYGAEVAMNMTLAANWKVSTGYTLLKTDLDLKNAADTSLASDKDSPAHQFRVQSLFNPARDWEFDTTLYYVEHIRQLDTSIPSYLRLDVRLGWTMSDQCTLDFVAQNLLDDQHPEFTTAGKLSTEVERAFLVRLMLRY